MTTNYQIIKTVPVLKVNNRRLNLEFYCRTLGMKNLLEEGAIVSLGDQTKSEKLVIEESPSMRTRKVEGPKKIAQITLKVADPKEIEEVTATVVRALDNVIDLNFYPLPNAQVTNRKYRSIGLGVSGYHHMLAKNHIMWESEEHLKFVDEVFENIAYASIKASNALAKERGSISTSKALNGKQEYTLINADMILHDGKNLKKRYMQQVCVMHMY